MKLFSILLFCLGFCLQTAYSAPGQVSSDSEAKALIESDLFIKSSFSERLKLLDEAIAELPENIDAVVWARLTEKKLYALITIGNYAHASRFLDEIEDRFFTIAEGEDFYLSALASGAFIYSYAGNIEKALEYAERAQKSDAYKTDTEQQFRLTTSLASIYVNVGYAELGAELLIDFYQTHKDADVAERLRFGLVSNISYALNQAGQYEKSLEYLEVVSALIDEFEAESALPEIDLKQLRWHYLSNVASNRIDLERFEELSDIASTMQRLSAEVGSPLLELRSRYVKAAAHFGEGNYAEAANLLETLIVHAEEINSVDLIVDYQKLKVLVLKKMERYMEALATLEALQDATARLDSQQGRSRLQYLNAQLSLQQKNFQIEELKTNQAISLEMRKRDRITSAILLGCALLFGVLAVSLYLSLRQSRLLAKALVIREQEAIRAADSKSRFLANMSHEIRTPLNALLGITQVLRQKPLGPDIQNSLSTMSDFGQMLLAIVNDVLDLSKIDAGKMKISISRTDVYCLLNELRDAWAPRLEEKGLVLNMSTGSDIPAVNIDPMRVRQCLNNLISNAVKFTDEGAVSIRTSYDSDQETLSFEISDTGIGIPPDRIEQLFEAFEQQDDSTVRRFGGTGLGLSIVRTLADLMGGSIRLQSAPGRGTTAILTLRAPVSPNPVLLKNPTVHGTVRTLPRVDRPSGPIRLLVVDDHAVNRMIISAFLASDTVEIVEAESANAALDILERDPLFDCMLLDNRMPVMDGADLIKVIRTNDTAYRNIRIIFITADAMEGDKEKYLNLGADGYISKPIIREDLIDELQRVTA